MKKFLSMILCAVILIGSTASAWAAELIDADEAAQKAVQNVQRDEKNSGSDADSPFSINSKFAILVDMNNSCVLFEQKADTKIQIASMTKIMTAIVAIENITNLSEKFVITDSLVSEVTSDESTAGFWIGETVTYEDLLYGLMLPSGADAAYALVNKVAGSSENFVKLMNQKAEELKLENTHFQNVVGLDNSQNYSTVRDVSTIFAYALENETFYTIDTTMKYTTSTGSHTFTSTIYDGQVAMGSNLEYLLGGKTGTTSGAGLCLASIAKQDGAYLMLVTANAEIGTTPYNIKDARTIYEYYFENYSYSTVKKSGSVLCSIPTYLCKDKTYDITADKDIVRYLPNDFDESKVNVEFDGVKQVNYKMKAGTKLGTVTVSYDGNPVETISAVLNEDMHFSLGAWIRLHPFYFILILLAVIALLGVIALLIILNVTGNLNFDRLKVKKKNRTSLDKHKKRSLPKYQNAPHKVTKAKLDFNKRPQKSSKRSKSSYEELKRQREQESHDWYDF